MGIFGYSYLNENINRLQALTMNGVSPTYENISTLKYPDARAMYIYAKKAHLDAIPGLKDYLAEWAKLWVDDGLLSRIGLIPSAPAAMAANAKIASEFTTLDGAQLN